MIRKKKKRNTRGSPLTAKLSLNSPQRMLSLLSQQNTTTNEQKNKEKEKKGETERARRKSPRDCKVSLELSTTYAFTILTKQHNSRKIKQEKRIRMKKSVYPPLLPSLTFCVKCLKWWCFNANFLTIQIGCGSKNCTSEQCCCHRRSPVCFHC